jgi:hypothetical protein
VGDHRVDDRVVLVPRDQDPCLGGTHLTVVLQTGVEQLGHHGGEVGVVEDDPRRLAAELERAPLEMLATGGPDHPSPGSAAGERHLVDPRM